MKTYLVSITFLTHVLFTFAQGGGVGINDTGGMPDSSAILDISSSNKGLLIPRISLTDTADVTTISGATTSLIVHNTNDTMAGGNGTGLYQWNGSKWIKLIAPENSPGNNGDVLTSKGSGQAPSWKAAASGGGGCLNKIEVFDSPGSFTWTRPAGVDLVYVTIVGAGGGGGGGTGGRSSTTFNNARSGGGGGGGGQSFFNYPIAVSGNISVTVGAGGIGGVGGLPSTLPGANGTDGGDSSFGTLVTKGGKGGSTLVGGASGGGLSIFYDISNEISPLSIPTGNAIGSPGGPGGSRSPNSTGLSSGISDGAFVGGNSGANGGDQGMGMGGGASSFGSGGNGGDEADAPLGSNGKPGSSSTGYGSGGGGGSGGRDNTATGGTGGAGGNGTGGFIMIQWSE